MKSLSPLFLAGLCAATFSGCYMDRNPTMTLEDRMFGEETDKSERVENKPLSVREYTALTNKLVNVDVFSPKLESGKTARAYLFVKLHDVTKGERSVEFCMAAPLPHSDRERRLVTVVGGDGLQLFPYEYGPGKSKPVKTGQGSQLLTEMMSGGAQQIISGQNDPGAGLPLPSGATSRFVVRSEGFIKNDKTHFVGGKSPSYKELWQFVATTGLIFEIECVVMPADEKIDSEKEAERLRGFIAEEWAKHSAK